MIGSGRPHEALRPYVRSLRGYDIVTDGPGTHLGLPSTGITFVLPLDHPLDVAWSGDPGSRRVMTSCLSGLHTIPARIRHPGVQRGVQLDLTPAGVRALLGIPASEIAAGLAELPEVAPAMAGLPERLHALTDWRERLGLVEATLVGTLGSRRVTGPRAEVDHALTALAGGAPVAAVAAEVGYSRRHLSTLVRAECGVTPKEFQRLARFERASSRLRGGTARGGSLAEVAAACGFADQAHLAREWRALAGVGPSEWLRQEFPFVQGGPSREE